MLIATETLTNSDEEGSCSLQMFIHIARYLSKESKNQMLGSFLPDEGFIPFTKIPDQIEISSSKDASLHIHFTEDRLITSLDGEENTIQFSKALTIISMLAEILSKHQPKRNQKRLVKLKNQFLKQIPKEAFYPALHEHYIDGEPVISFNPKAQRVMIKSLEKKISVPLKTLLKCLHFFNQKFINRIAPKMGVESTFLKFYEGIIDGYLGRRALGVFKAGYEENFPPETYRREIHRLVQQIQSPSSDYFNPPIL